MSIRQSNMTNHLLVSSENKNTRTTLNKTLAGELKEQPRNSYTTKLCNKVLCYSNLDSPNLMIMIKFPFDECWKNTHIFVRDL